MLTNLLLSWGLDRDHWAFLVGKVLSIATLITTGVLDVGYWLTYVGLHPSVTLIHIIQVAAVVVLYVSGQFSTSNLPGRKLGAILLACVLTGAAVFSMPACHPPVTIVTPQGQAAYAADQVILRLTEISHVVIDDTGTKPGNIKPADAFTIIEWISGDAHATPPTTGIAQLVETTAGQGWKAAARQGWQSRIRQIFERYPKLALYVGIIDATLEVF